MKKGLTALQNALLSVTSVLILQRMFALPF